MAKKQIIDIDAEFEGIEFDEEAIKRATGISKREENGWAEKNQARRLDPNYDKRVAKSISDTYQTEEGRKKQAAKAVPHTEQSREKLKLANIGKKRKGEAWIAGMVEKQKGNTKRCKKIMTPHGIFDSLNLAVQATGISPGRIRRYTRELPWANEWYFITKDKFSSIIPKEKSNNKCYKPIQTPEGLFNKMADAARHYMNVLNYTEASCKGWLIRMMKTDPKNFYYVKK